MTLGLMLKKTPPKKFYDFDVTQNGETKIFFVEAPCLEVAVREARHRFARDRLNPEDRIDLGSGRCAFEPSSASSKKEWF